MPERKLRRLLVEWEIREPNGRFNVEEKTFYEGQIDEFFHFLVLEGFYDDITIQKRFSIKEEVINRMKGR